MCIAAGSRGSAPTAAGGSSGCMMSKRKRHEQQQQAADSAVEKGSNSDGSFGDFLLQLAYAPSSFYCGADDSGADGTKLPSGALGSSSSSVGGDFSVNVFDFPVDPIIKYKLEIEANFSLRCLLQGSAFDYITSSAEAGLSEGLKTWREQQTVYVFPPNYTPSNNNNNNNSSSNLTLSEIVLICDPYGYYSPDILAPEVGPGTGDSSNVATVAAYKMCRLQFQYAILSALDTLLSGVSDCFYIMGAGSASAVYFNSYFYSNSRRSNSSSSNGDGDKSGDGFECIISGVRNAFVQRLIQRGCDVSFVERTNDTLTIDQRRNSQLARGGSAVVRTLRIAGRDQIRVVADSLAELALLGGRARKTVDVPAIISCTAFKFSLARCDFAATPVACSHDFSSGMEGSRVADDSSSSTSSSKMHRLRISGVLFAHRTSALVSLLQSIVEINATSPSILEPLYVRPEDRRAAPDTHKIDAQSASSAGAAGGAKNPLVIGVRSRTRNKRPSPNTSVNVAAAIASGSSAEQGEEELYFRIRYFSSDDSRDFCYRGDSPSRFDTTINSLTWRRSLGSSVVLVDMERAERCRIVNHLNDDICQKAAHGRAPSVEDLNGGLEDEDGVVLEPANKYSIYAT